MTPEEGPAPLRGAKALAAHLMTMGYFKPAPPPQPEPPKPVEVHPRPDFARVKRLAGLSVVSSGNNCQIDAHPIFVRPRQDYPSYSDFWRLVDLDGFQACEQDEVRLTDYGATYIFTGPEGIPDCSHAHARCIFWQFEYAGQYTNQPNCQTCQEQWSSDPAHAARTGAQYVLCGSHPDLNPEPSLISEKTYDVLMLAYLVDRRRAIQAALDRYRWPSDYPGHDTQARHEQLTQSRLMLHVNQHDIPALAPLRMALAAAYHLPVIAEAVQDAGPYRDAVLWVRYEMLPTMTAMFLDGRLEADYLYDSLYNLLCVEHPFRNCVERALMGADVRAVA